MISIFSQYPNIFTFGTFQILLEAQELLSRLEAEDFLRELETEEDHHGVESSYGVMARQQHSPQTFSLKLSKHMENI